MEIFYSSGTKLIMFDQRLELDYTGKCNSSYRHAYINSK
jgi:hypothetical protein